ncbi:MAG: hypothetical protein K0U66_04700 [Gammaproteobacteria bacterium]|nr:hypothetical protein [Gammaproteobacteria bacterium]
MAQPTIAEVVPAARHVASSREEFEASVRLRNRRRVQIFLVVFVLATAAALIWNYSRPPVFETLATLKITPRNNPDRSAGVDPPNPVEVQRQMMLSPSVLKKLHDQVVVLQDGDFSISALRRIVDAHRVPRTDTVRLRAHGEDPEFLPVVLNAWADIYVQKQRAAEAAVAVTDGDAAEREVEALDKKLKAKRKEVEEFRREHNIVSPQREENRVAARLRGLNDAHNKAIDKEADASGKLSAVRSALKAGKIVGNTKEARSLSSLIVRVEELRQEMREYEENFTPEYMKIDPKIRAVRESLANLEKRVTVERKTLARSALAEAEQALDAARQARSSIDAQRTEFRKEANQFSANFARLQSLLAELESLEELTRETKRQRVKKQVKGPTLPPQVEIAEAAYVPDAPISPLYLRDAGIGVGGALLLGLLSVLAYEFFIRPVVPPPNDSSTTLVYAADGMRLENQAPPAPTMIEQHVAPRALARAFPRELSPAEVTSVLDAVQTAPAVQALVCGLMSGMSVEEAAYLSWSDIDTARGQLTVRGRNARILDVGERLRSALGAMPPDAPDALVWHTPQGAPFRVAELEQLVMDAMTRVPSVADASVAGLRHTYAAYLARQGAGADDLQRVVGDLERDEIAHVLALAPPGTSVSFADLDRIYPSLKGV